MAITTPRPWLASYAEGVPARHRAARPGSLYDLVARLGRAVPRQRRPRVLRAHDDATPSSATQIERAAEGLRLLGVQKGDPVALVLPNCPQHIVAFYAVLRLGAIVVEHNPLYTPRELRHQFEDHGATVVIAWDKVVETHPGVPGGCRGASTSSRST